MNGGQCVWELYLPAFSFFLCFKAVKIIIRVRKYICWIKAQGYLSKNICIL